MLHGGVRIVLYPKTVSYSSWLHKNDINKIRVNVELQPTLISFLEKSQSRHWNVIRGVYQIMCSDIKLTLNKTEAQIELKPKSTGDLFIEYKSLIYSVTQNEYLIIIIF